VSELVRQQLAAGVGSERRGGGSEDYVVAVREGSRAKRAGESRGRRTCVDRHAAQILAERLLHLADHLGRGAIAGLKQSHGTDSGARRWRFLGCAPLVAADGASAAHDTAPWHSASISAGANCLPNF